MAKKDTITKDNTFGEVLNKYPESAGIMMKHGLHCVGCHIAVHETIEQGALAHGMSKEELEGMIKELNKLIEK